MIISEHIQGLYEMYTDVPQVIFLHHHLNLCIFQDIEPDFVNRVEELIPPLHSFQLSLKHFKYLM